MPKAKANGVTLDYELRGEGDPLVLICGFRRSRQVWGEPFLAPLARRFRLVLFDNRGTGGSDKPREGYSIEGFADDTAALLDALAIDAAHVFGVSMGGMIAQRLAVRHPDRVRTLGLGCTHHGGPNTVRTAPEDWALLQLKPGPEMDVDQVARAQEPVYFHPNFIRDHRDVIEELYQRMKPYAPEPYVVEGHLAAIQAFDGEAQLGEIEARTLVVTGDSDRLIVPENSRRIVERIADAQLVVLPEANHLFWIEKPAEAAAAIIDFIG